MSTKEKIVYKGIHLPKNEELKYLELVMDDKNIHDHTSYIITISIVTECCEKIRPKYLVLNKLHSDFVLTQNLRKFTSNHLFGVLKSVGIKNFILLVGEKSETYDYKTLVKEILDPSYMIGFKSIEDMENWMRQQK